MNTVLRGTCILGLLLLCSAGVAKADTFLEYSLGKVTTTGTITSVSHLGSFRLDVNGLADSSDPLDGYIVGKSFTVDTVSGSGIFSGNEDITFLKLNNTVLGDNGGLTFLGYALAGPQLYDDSVADPTLDAPGVFKLTDATGALYELRVSQLPEPSSLILLAVGLAALAIVRLATRAKQNA